MERTINIDGRDVKFRSSGKLPAIYRAYTGRSFFGDFDSAPTELAQMDTEIAEDMIWCSAKLAADHDHREIASELEWMDGFDTFNTFDIFAQIYDLLLSSFSTQKKTAEAATEND